MHMRHCRCCEQILESTKDGSKENEPMAFEIGAGDIINNPLFQVGDSNGRCSGSYCDISSSATQWREQQMGSGHSGNRTRCPECAAVARRCGGSSGRNSSTRV